MFCLIWIDTNTGERAICEAVKGVVYHAFPTMKAAWRDASRANREAIKNGWASRYAPARIPQGMTAA